MRLYSLLIAEDEDNTREGLTNYIDWSELGFQVVASVRDGEDAIRYMEQQAEPIDVILSDIRMEKISGLELAKYVSEKKLGTSVILLTAYRDFEYAQKAITYQVVEYLLKPVKIQELKRTFQKVRQQIEASEALNGEQEERGDRDLVEKAKRYINQHYMEKTCSLELVAANVGVVPSHLSKLFRQKTGKTFTDYITRERIDAAKDLLRHTNLKIHEISAQLGYGSTRHFSKIFRNATGILPTEYRERGEEGK
jgi:two-component system response regulator YesN